MNTTLLPMGLLRCAPPTPVTAGVHGTAVPVPAPVDRVRADAPAVTFGSELPGPPRGAPV